MNARPIAVVIDGTLVASSRPAIVERGRVYAPADPYAQLVAKGIDCVDECRQMRLTLHDRSIVVRIAPPSKRENGAIRHGEREAIGFLRGGVGYVPLAEVARGLGAAVAYDGESKTVTIALPPSAAVASPTPYAGRAKPIDARTFPPVIAPTPEPTITGIPKPRRTPILVEPGSQSERRM